MKDVPELEEPMLPDEAPNKGKGTMSVLFVHADFGDFS